MVNLYDNEDAELERKHLMSLKADVIAAVKRMVQKVSEPKLQKRFEGFTKRMQMNYSDLDLHVFILFENGNATVSEGVSENPDITVTTDSKTILSILDGSLSAMRAFMSGKIKADGSTRDLMKLQHLLKA
jgi:putative sterol carrier protein